MSATSIRIIDLSDKQAIKAFEAVYASLRDNLAREFNKQVQNYEMFL